MEVEILHPDVAEAATDHGLLSGLGDDDHPQYTLTAEAQAMADAAEAAAAAALSAHVTDPTDAHDASAVSVADVAGNFTATDVEGALAELALLTGVIGLVDLTDVTGEPPAVGEAPVWDGDSFELTDVATQAELDAHINDAGDAHDASAISILDTAGDFAATDVEGALAELVTETVAKDSVVVAGTRLVENKLLAGDAQPAFRILGNGTMYWGAGGASAVDTSLYRASVAHLETQSRLHFVRTLATDLTITQAVSGEGNSRFVQTMDGKMEWGPGVAVRDVNLYRSAANVLATDDKLDSASLNLQVKSGVPVDGDVVGGAASGDVILDVTNSRIYFRVGATWKYAALT